ncbi:MAG TPA: hypothetical protein VGQ00_01110 [Candidatus Norongarragalinales archaeon]|jgi:preprotein translocase subunit SecD|nr:hypothetical protein [Candidatus Norongarragalinales archaeon]
MVDFARLAGNRRIQFIVLVVAIALFLLFLRDFNPNTLDVNLGIEFVGGVRIPVSLEKSVDPTTMSTIVDTIKQRVNKFGLSQAVVRPLGDKEVIVEIPRSSPDVIHSVEKILREQGTFTAIIDGQVALTGDDILGVGGPGAERLPSQLQRNGWEIDFAIRPSANEKFAQVAKGKPHYPVYMFLDRPENAALLAGRNKLGLTEGESGPVLDALNDALRKEGDDIALVFTEDFNSTEFDKLNKTRVIVPDSFEKEHPAMFQQLRALGYLNGTGCTRCITQRPDEEFMPLVTPGSDVGGVSRWRVIGLLSAPQLSPDLAQGEVVSPRYSISGSVTSTGGFEEADREASKDLKELKTVLTGGKLPVATTIGSAYTVSPSLGSQFLTYSFIGAILALLVVSIIIVIRYRNLGLIVPIILTDVIEITVLLAILGAVGTVDLAAMAGIIALIGTGVDDQLIITDEMLRRKPGEAETGQITSTAERLKRAFEIVFTGAGIAIVTMLPLVLSGIVEVQGFGIATILGVLIGVLITRPAYGVLVEELFGRKI